MLVGGGGTSESLMNDVSVVRTTHRRQASSQFHNFLEYSSFIHRNNSWIIYLSAKMSLYYLA